ncbi:hypothetical protein DFH08DRAFT_825958 [Mycena albidolilacea]|uniref:Uncharacterized protein n=1 Tax=Mycena albidolilacea TaxID=1033008 RepID=A0AAD7E9M2_9AGAR|nr:hypothetical protein DFH08DRAFT_825958 [Mycena albidolilacea]
MITKGCPPLPPDIYHEAVDQRDKWKYKFGLAMHTRIDPFIGLIHWLKIWWTNSNPSDPGTENYGLANGHTMLRHLHDPSLKGTPQHCWMTSSGASLEPPAPLPVQPKPAPIVAPLSIPRGCPGQVLPLQEGKASFLSYPLGLHAARDLPWGVEFGPDLIIRSYNCKRQSEVPGVFYPCEKLLRHPIVRGILERNKDGFKSGTQFAYLTTGDAQTLPQKKTEELNGLKLAGLTLSRTLLVRATHLAAHSKLRIAVAQGNVPRIHSIVANDLRNGASIFATLEKIGRATEGNFDPKSYTHADHQLLYLLLQLGGHAAAELGHRCLGLPSISATKRHIATVPLVVSPRAPIMTEMQHNLEVGFPAPFPLRPDGSIGPGYQIMVDEIKVEGKMRWDARANTILGICREHSDEYELEFLSMKEAEALQAGLAENKVHLASEAAVVAVNSFSGVPIPTDGQRRLLCAALNTANIRASRIGGRAYCISSDGDGKRRAATLLFTFIRELDRNGPLFKKLGELPLFDYHCGEDDITGNIDYKHTCKRLRSSLIRQIASTIDGVVLTRQLIKQHLLRKSRHNFHHISGLLNPNDRQNVKYMYDLLSSIAVLPEAKETHSPAFKNTRRVLRLLGAFYCHILEAYTNIKLSLHEQLTHISAAMHLMMVLYQKEAGRFVPSQTYFDFMTTGKNLFFCVAKTQLDDPSGEFWIIPPGTDPVELTFGRVRTMTGSESNTDMSQLGSRLNAAMHCDNILAENPEWTRGPQRLRMPVWQDVAGDVSAKIDLISPHSWPGDVHVANVSCKTTWFGGRRIAERELLETGWEPPSKSMEETGGFNIFCPFGKDEMVLLGRPHVEERNEDDEDRDVPTQSPSTTTESPVPADSDTVFLPDLEDTAQETVVNLEPAAKPHEPYLAVPGSTTKQHKSTILRLFSSRFSVAESRDRLKRVRGFSRHNEATTGGSNSKDAIPGEPMVLVEDPAAILVRSNGFPWLAVVIISSISYGTKQVESLPKRLLGEPNVRVKIQIMELEPTQNLSDPGSEEGDWEWTDKFVAVSASGTLNICEVNGSLLQLLNPAVLPATSLRKKGAATYHFKSVELVAIAFIFVPNSDSMFIQALRASYAIERLVEHMAIHLLFDQNPPLNRDATTCGFCLSTDSFCTIVLIKGKGSDGAVRIDLVRSRCPNLGNLGLASAANSSRKRPCTNRPMVCPVSPCPDVVWKYALKNHIQTVHPHANLSNYKSYYELAEDEEVELKRLSTTKKRKSTKKKISVRISPSHSTEAALGPSQAEDDDEEDIDDDSSRCSSPERAPQPGILRALSPDEEMPLATGHSIGQSSRRHTCGTGASEFLAGSAESADADAPSDTVLAAPDTASLSSELNSPMESQQAQLNHRVDQQVSDVVPDLPLTRRSAHVSRRRTVVSSDEEDEEEGCSISGCTITGSEPMVTCLWPACSTQSHLCCAGLKLTDLTIVEWFCDDNCREDAGGRVRKRRRIAGMQFEKERFIRRHDFDALQEVVPTSSLCLKASNDLIKKPKIKLQGVKSVWAQRTAVVKPRGRLVSPAVRREKKIDIFLGVEITSEHTFIEFREFRASTLYASNTAAEFEIDAGSDVICLLSPTILQPVSAVFASWIHIRVL